MQKEMGVLTSRVMELERKLETITKGVWVTMRDNPETTKALDTLNCYGVLARSPEEAELLEWFRQLTPTEQECELSRAQGMAQAMYYLRMKGERLC